MIQRYMCPKCHWTGTEEDMLTDYIGDGELSDELYSNYICPKCGTWYFNLSDYIMLKRKWR